MVHGPHNADVPSRLETELTRRVKRLVVYVFAGVALVLTALNVLT